MKSLLFVSILFLSGCATFDAFFGLSTELTEKQFDPYKGGAFVYHRAGSLNLENERKERGFKMAREICQGEFSIVKEGVREDRGRLIYFKCADQPAVQAQK